MKRYIHAATWNGIVSVRTILKNSDLNKEQATDLSEYIYDEHLDEGFKHLDDFLDFYDLDDLYKEAFGTEVKATEEILPHPGFLKTSKFTAPSIKTDEQRNALEAFEIAVTQKYKQFDALLSRQLYLTSDTAWTGKIDEYETGYYVQVEATRSNFNAFVQGDTVIRKPRNPGEKIATYEIEGYSGTVHWMSRAK